MTGCVTGYVSFYSFRTLTNDPDKSQPFVCQFNTLDSLQTLRFTCDRLRDAAFVSNTLFSMNFRPNLSHLEILERQPNAWGENSLFQSIEGSIVPFLRLRCANATFNGDERGMQRVKALQTLCISDLSDREVEELKIWVGVVSRQAIDRSFL